MENPAKGSAEIHKLGDIHESMDSLMIIKNHVRANSSEGKRKEEVTQ